MIHRHRSKPLTPEIIEVLKLMYKFHVPATTTGKLTGISNITVGKYYGYYKLSGEPTFTLDDILTVNVKEMIHATN